MLEVEWKCPECGAGNTDDAVKAGDYTCQCRICGAECEVYFDIDISVTEVKKI